MHEPRLKLAVVLLCGLAAGGTALAQERVAQLSQVAGKVTIGRAGNGKVDEARALGPRILNGSVFAGDVVVTDPGATATVLFTDGTAVEVKEKTRLTIEEHDLSALMKAGKAAKPKGRTIRVLAGDILAKVAPNAEIATEFETPAGVAAVKGTELSISVDPDAKPKPGAAAKPTVKSRHKRGKRAQR